MNYQPTSQTQFAAALSISQGYLSQIENGVRTPSSDTLNALQAIVEGETNVSTNKDEVEEKSDEA